MEPQHVIISERLMNQEFDLEKREFNSASRGERMMSDHKKQQSVKVESAAD